MKYDYEMDFNDINSQVYNIRKFIKPKTRVLDIGCAAGRFGKYLKDKLSCYVTGIDKNCEYRALCEKNLDEFYILDVNNTNLLKNFLNQRQFDFIILADVVEHLIDDKNFLSLLSNLTKAYIIISIPNISFWEIRLKLFFGFFEYTEFGILDKTHLHFYNLYYAKKILRENFFILDESHSSWYTLSEKMLYLQRIPVIKKIAYHIRHLLTLLFPNFYASQLIFLLTSKRNNSSIR